MAKVKAKKTVKKVKSGTSNTKRNLLVIGGALVAFGLILLFVQIQNTASQQESQLDTETVESSNPTALGPSQGCSLTGTNYVCDIKITNPKDEPLAWSSVINGLDGASLSGGGYGTVAPQESIVVQLTVPKAFCDTNPDGEGNVLILEDKKSSNQGETEFECTPDEVISETPVAN